MKTPVAHALVSTLMQLQNCRCCTAGVSCKQRSAVWLRSTDNTTPTVPREEVPALLELGNEYDVQSIIWTMQMHLFKSQRDTRSAVRVYSSSFCMPYWPVECCSLQTPAK